MAYGAGVACLATSLLAVMSGRILAVGAVEAFTASIDVDQAGWSAQRIAAYAASRISAEPAVALLRIPRLDLAVPVLEGIEATTLDRGAGHVPETARPGDRAGNIAIAGHRDGFFRRLKDVRPGDVIHLETPGSKDDYLVERAWVVEPEDVSVLEPTASPSVTLITCYPFYYVGAAPQRFIVRAVRQDP